MNDLTGKSIFLKNAAISWGMHVFVVISGFIVPRFIDDQLGPVLLGIWDLGWASVQYMTLTGMGIGAALNRYVSLNRGSGDIELLEKTATAALVWQIVIATLVMLITISISLSLPHWSKIDANDIDQAQMVLLLLGISLAIKMLFDHAGGILTGYHLWWVQNSLTTLQDVTIAISIITILLLGGNLVHMAVAVVASSGIFSISRMILARRLCPQVVINLKSWDKRNAVELLRFGMKNLVGMTPHVLIFQTGAILLMGHVNPAALALYNRGVALARHIDVLIRKIATMLVPMTSSLIGMKKRNDAVNLLLQGTTLSMSLAVPAIVVLFLFGDLVLSLWMGQDYSDRSLMMIISAGALLPIGTTGTYSVLAGFNAHGKIAIASLIITLLAIAIGIYMVSLVGWSITSVAILCAISWTAGRFLPVPYYLHRYFKIKMLNYLSTAIVKPFVINIPFILVLYISRTLLDYGNYLISTFVLIGAVFINIILYWKYLLTANQKQIIGTKASTILSNFTP